jgi:hypothetical protein
MTRLVGLTGSEPYAYLLAINVLASKDDRTMVSMFQLPSWKGGPSTRFYALEMDFKGDMGFIELTVK